MSSNAVTKQDVQVDEHVDGDGAITTLVKGALAGVAATWLMDRVTTYLYENESKAAREKEDSARGDRTAYEIAADKTADAVGISLSDDERKKAGNSIHWALGATAGIVYATMKRDPRTIAPLAGIGFGTLFWAVMDEAVTPALGLTPGPEAFPLQTHARGLAGHAVLGATIDASLAVVNGII